MMVAVMAVLQWAGEPSWREVGPLLDRWCNDCHRAGQVGPFDFTSYEGAVAYAPEIARYVLGGKMPPWRAKPSGVEWANSRGLPDEVTAKLLAWTNTGMKPGKAVMKKRHPQWNLGVPGVVLSQPGEHTVAAERTVDIVRFTAGPEELGNGGKDVYFDGFELRPSNRALLHRALLRVEGEPIAAWAMSDGGLRLPAGVAWKIGAGKKLEVELHYFKRNLRPARDLTRVALYWAKGKPGRVARLLELKKEALRIPAGANVHREAMRFRLPSGARVYAVLPVFQLLATQVRMKWGDERDYFLWVEPFEHHLMSSYLPARPLSGRELEVEAVYDNSAQNPYNPHQKLREVRFEENGLDETFRVWLTVGR